MYCCYHCVLRAGWMNVLTAPQLQRVDTFQTGVPTGYLHVSLHIKLKLETDRAQPWQESLTIHGKQMQKHGYTKITSKSLPFSFSPNTERWSSTFTKCWWSPEEVEHFLSDHFYLVSKFCNFVILFRWLNVRFFRWFRHCFLSNEHCYDIN